MHKIIAIEAGSLRPVAVLPPKSGEQFQSPGAPAAEQQPVAARVSETDQSRFVVVVATGDRLGRGHGRTRLLTNTVSKSPVKTTIYPVTKSPYIKLSRDNFYLKN